MRLGTALAVMGLGLAASAAMAEPTPARQDQLRGMLAQDCGSCHGMTLKGGLGSPLLPELMSQFSAEALAETILDGRPGTPMPPWKTMLSRDDALWLARLLMGETR